MCWMQHARFVNFEDPIPMYVSGFGPKSLALAGKHGDGLVLSVPPDPVLAEGLWKSVERGAADAGRTIDRTQSRHCTDKKTECTTANDQCQI